MRKLFSTSALSYFIAFLILASPALGNICGDCNGDGAVNISDIVYLGFYLMEDGPAPTDLVAADLDEKDGVNLHDCWYLIQYMFYGGNLPVCGSHPVFTPPESDDILEIRNTLVPAGADKARVDLYLISDDPLRGISFPFNYYCATSNLTLDSISIEYAIIDPLQGIIGREIFEDIDKGFLGFMGFSEFPNPATGLIASLYFSLTESASDQSIEITTTTTEPSNTFIFGKEYGYHYLEAFVPVLLDVPISIPDADFDGIADYDDNCPNLYNDGQEDADGDNVGDLCDNCPSESNYAQDNTDGDDYGDACDNCPDDVNNDQVDYDADGFGDLCDICPEDYDPDQLDSDGDGLGNACDNCPYVANASQEDTDGDNTGDACEFVADVMCGDANGDGYFNIADASYIINFLFNNGPPPCQPNK